MSFDKLPVFYPKGPPRQVNAEEAASMMEEESGYIILDVRTAQEYSEKHIPGAINIPNETIGTKTSRSCQTRSS